MKSARLLPLACVVAAISALAGAAHAATVLNADKTFTSNPPVADIYGYTDPAGKTWTVDGNITVGNGTAADSRLFVGLRWDASNFGNGMLTLTTTTAGSSLLLNGYHSADPVLGRLGHVYSGNHTGTLNIDGGLAVNMGGRKMKYEGGTNTINLVNGSLNYTTEGFGWLESGAVNAFVNHVIGVNGSLIVPGVITDAAGFASWAQTSGSGVELNDVTVSPASGLFLVFTNNGATTTITAVDLDGDDDGLPDDWETLHGLDPDDDGSININNGADGDPDSDFLSNVEEYAADTHPNDNDSDDDGLIDGDETNTGVWAGSTATGTDPLDNDSDNDGFHDGAETNDGTFDSYDYASHTGDTGTNPNIADTDGDGLLDGVENGSGTFTSPASPGTNPTLADTDGDGMNDSYEVTYQLDPNDNGSINQVNGANGDLDGDGVTNIDEHNRGSNPGSASGAFSAVDASATMQAVESGDLLQSNFGSVAASSAWVSHDGLDPAVSAALLANGTFESGAASPESNSGFPGETGDWIEFNFNTTTHTAGYNITRIDTFAKWTDRRSRQAYSIEVRPVGGAWTTLAPETVWTAGVPVDGQFTRVRHLGNGAVGGALASGIDAIRFNFEDVENENIAWAMYREIDVIGEPVIVSQPELKIVGFDMAGDFVLDATGLDPAKTYELKRSINLTSFESLTPPILMEGANGATQQAKDGNPPAGKAFYRLETTP
jgi:hypothetical protein